MSLTGALKYRDKDWLLFAQLANSGESCRNLSGRQESQMTLGHRVFRRSSTIFNSSRRLLGYPYCNIRWQDVVGTFSGI